MMKRIRKFAALLLALVMIAGLFETNTVQTQAASNKKIVILYFSATGTTKGVAKKIKKATNGKLIQIKATKPYTADDLDYGDENSRVTMEHNSASSPAKSSVRPKIANLSAIKKAVKEADVVYIGYPIWWGGSAAHCIYISRKCKFEKENGNTILHICQQWDG